MFFVLCCLYSIVKVEGGEGGIVALLASLESVADAPWA